MLSPLCMEFIMELFPVCIAFIRCSTRLHRVDKVVHLISGYLVTIYFLYSNMSVVPALVFSSPIFKSKCKDPKLLLSGNLFVIIQYICFICLRFLSILGFVINIVLLMSMAPVLLGGQWYILTYRFSQDHLELLFNCIKASGRVHN